MTLLAGILVATGAIIVALDNPPGAILYPKQLGLVIIAVGFLVWAIQ